MVLIVSMLIGSKNEELRELMQPAKTMMQQFLIFEKMGLSIFQHPTSRFQVFKLAGIRVHMGIGGIKHLILQESMLLVGMKLRVTGITLPNGYLVQGSMEKWNNRWFYLTDSGAAAKNWKKIDGIWYYFNKENQMEIGWIQDKEQWYYLDVDGSMKTGWLQYKGQWY